eukprot:10710168-Alexandrium_andersonii.AAC.1
MCIRDRVSDLRQVARQGANLDRRQEARNGPEHAEGALDHVLSDPLVVPLACQVGRHLQRPLRPVRGVLLQPDRQRLAGRDAEEQPGEVEALRADAPARTGTERLHEAGTQAARDRPKRSDAAPAACIIVAGDTPRAGQSAGGLPWRGRHPRHH